MPKLLPHINLPVTANMLQIVLWICLIGGFYLDGAQPQTLNEEPSELVALVTLSRHGTRAPNPTVLHLCPNNEANIRSYQVPFSQLTEVGMQQLQDLGSHIRDVYVTEKNFLAGSLENGINSTFDGYFRADVAERCGQSAASMGYGLYPNNYKEQPLPIYMQNARSERDFGVTQAPCWEKWRDESIAYETTIGQMMFLEHFQLLEKVGNACGVKVSKESLSFAGESRVSGIKDISDMFEFDNDQNYPLMPGMTKEMQFDLLGLEFRNLMQELYSTPEKITMWSANFPYRLIEHFRTSIKEWELGNKVNRPKLFSYHGHRELLHGFGLMLGYKFHFDNMPVVDGSTPLHPATTLFFELHERKGEYFVKMYVWSSKTQRTAIEIPGCGYECPLENIEQTIQSHIKATGTWQQICGLEQQPNIFLMAENPNAKTVTNVSKENAISPGISFFLGLFCTCSFGGFVLSFYKRSKRQGYFPI